MTNPNENENRGTGRGNGLPTVVPASGRLRLPPDLRTDEEKAEDDRAAEEYWERRMKEGYGIKEKDEDDGTGYWRKVGKDRRREERRARRRRFAQWLRVALNWAVGRQRCPR